MHSTTLSRHRFAAALAAGAGALALPHRAGAQARTAIVVSATTPSDTLPFFYALKQGMFEKAGLDVTAVPSPGGAASVVAVVGGAAQIGFCNTLTLAAAHLKGVPVALLAPGGEYNTNAPHATLQVLPDAPIRSAKDLEGKVVAVTGLHDLLSVSTQAWIEKAGADPTKVKFIELPPGTMLAALQSKRVDAAAVYEPYQSAALVAGMRTLGKPYDAIAPRFLTAGWFTTTTWINDHHDAALRFAQIVNQSQEYTNAHYDELIPFIAEFSKQTPEVLAKMPHVHVPNTTSPASIQPLIDLAVKFKELSQPFKAADLIMAGVP